MKNKANEKKRLIVSILLTIGSGIIQAYIIESMMRPSGLISMGFTGLALLLHMGLEKIHINLSVSFFLIVLNLPVAVICAKAISKRFTILSLLQILSASVCLMIFDFKPFFSSVILNITVGAFVYGIQIVMALKAGGSTGGTDLSLYMFQIR